MKSTTKQRAYHVWERQKDRCYNQNSPLFKWYGAKGIKVEYKSAEFVEWWVKEFEKKQWKSPTVGRIDHFDNYRFGNIEMQERRDNSLERLQRSPKPDTSRPVLVLDYKTKEPIMYFKSLQEASVITGVPKGNICKICNLINGRKKTRSGLTFKYLGDK